MVVKLKNFLKVLSYVFFVPYLFVVVFLTVCLLNYNDYNITEIGDKSFIIIRDDELEARLVSSGHDCSSSASVTKTTDYLIVPFMDYTSTKVEKARKYNESNPGHKINIVTLDEFKLNESSYLREV